jgi:short-subunit dehydrogenase
MHAFKSKYGPWAIVAGASEGLGAAFAEELAKRGLNLILIARRLEKLEVLYRKSTIPDNSIFVLITQAPLEKIFSVP